MARIRTIKPEFWTNERVMECSAVARLLFIGMWNFSDDLGRLSLSAKTLKAQIFPSDDLTSENILGMLQELSANGLIFTYEVEGRTYVQISGWQHQRIDKPQPAKHPGPVNGYSTTIPGMFLDGREGKGEEGKVIEPSSLRDEARSPASLPTVVLVGEPLPIEKPVFASSPVSRETKPKRAKARTPLPDEWRPSERDIAHATERGFAAEQITTMAAGFSNHHRARGNLMADWSAAWRTWSDNEIKFQRDRGNGHGRSRALQDESLSVSRAIDKRLAAPGTLVFPPRPSLLPVEREDDCRLLPAGRSAES